MPTGDDGAQRQLRVGVALESRRPKLAGIYRAAHAALASPAVAGGEVARVAVVCHCMRELVNGLPSALKTPTLTRARGKQSSESLKLKLPKLLSKHPVDLRQDQDLIPVPREIAGVVADIINAVEQEGSRNLINAAVLVTGGSDTNHPLLKQWREAEEFFFEWTHLDRNDDNSRALPTDAEILAHIEVVEAVIEVQTTLFFANLHAVQDLLDEANSQDDGGSQ